MARRLSQLPAAAAAEAEALPRPTPTVPPTSSPVASSRIGQMTASSTCPHLFLRTLSTPHATRCRLIDGIFWSVLHCIFCNGHEIPVG
ncbi:hypothetical protein KC329_g5 [Hortaea werneckii]|nr:hypothetical protein KC329_g5 [Hortaea werneckii]